MTGVDYRQGDYRVVAGRLRPAASHLVDLADVRAGQLVLDVAAGTGNVAKICRDRGARTVAVDLVREQLLLDREPGIALVQADAQALPIADAVADAVLSTFGVIFAPDAAAVIHQLARTSRSSGVVGLTSWPAGGFQDAQGRLLTRLTGLRAGNPDHMGEWGDPDVLRERLGAIGDVEIAEGELVSRYPSIEQWWASRAASAPPVVAARQRLDADGIAHLDREMQALAERWMTEERGQVVLRESYLVATARRGHPASA